MTYQGFQKIKIIPINVLLLVNINVITCCCFLEKEMNMYEFKMSVFTYKFNEDMLISATAWLIHTSLLLTTLQLMTAVELWTVKTCETQTNYTSLKGKSFFTHNIGDLI